MDVQKHVEKADEARRKRNYPYAVQLLHQVLAVKPDHGDAYRVLCETLREQHSRKPTPAWLAKIAGLPFLVSSGVAAATKGYAARARSLTKYLKLEPTNPAVYRKLGESLSAAGHDRGAVAIFEAWAEIEPRSGEAWRSAAAAMQRSGEPEKALECLDKALEADPRDNLAERMRKDISADVTLRKGAYERASSSRDLMKDAEQARKLERAQRTHRTEDELEEEGADLRAALESDPRNGRARRSLADVLARAKKYDEARAVLEEGIGHDDNEEELRDRIGDVRVSALDVEIRKLEKRVAETGADGAKDDLEMLQTDRRNLQIDEYQRRVESRPTDLVQWYRLGKVLHEAEHVDDAIGALQRAVKEPKSRLDSLVRLGDCFHRKGMLDLAEKQLQTALDESSPSSERGKSILYDLGRIAVDAGRREDALAHFSRVYEQDIQYRDVADRVEALRTEE